MDIVIYLFAYIFLYNIPIFRYCMRECFVLPL